MEKTIAAISTPAGRGGISVIRISGDNATGIADKVFRGAVRLSDVPSHTVHYGHIVFDGERVDEVLATVMLAPKTFTRENVVEISTHGGIAVTARVLEAIILSGAEPAEPGEFTKRAFLNGRIDLSQAEAVIDIINADNALSHRNALSQLDGALSEEIRALRAELVHLAAQMQVLIDYPDEDLADVTEEDILNVCTECRARTEKLIKSADSGALIKDGIRTVIAGKPNVGKSSLLNALARYERAIVTEVAGTTRDTIEEKVSLGGVPLVLVDTAGIHHTEDRVEKIGVEKSRQSVESADLVIAVLDGSGAADEDDIAVLESTADKNRIILVNKTDIGHGKYAAEIRERAGGDTVIEISAATGEGIDELSEEIKRRYNIDGIARSGDTVVTNIRHKAALVTAKEALCRAAEAIEMGMPSDIASIDISDAIRSLGEITGETVSEAVVNDIFHSFCVGK